MLYKFKTLNLIIIILSIVVFSITLKLKDIDFAAPTNQLTTYDAYRFARYAFEIKNHLYSKIDYLANVPDFGINQYPPPLLSLLAVWMSNLSGLQIYYFLVIIPVLCSVLFIIPFYYWIEPLKNNYALLGGVILCIYNVNYFLRTQPGYFDTDCLMLFFVFSITLFITKSVVEKDNKPRSYLFILVAGLLMIVFRWWYDHLFFALIFSLSLLIGLIVQRHSVKDTLLKMLLFISFCSPVELAYYILHSPFLRDYLYGSLIGAKEYKTPLNIYASIAEMQPASLNGFISLTTDNPYTFFLGIAFFCLFFVRHFSYMITSLPLIVIGFSAFYTGYRYMIFASPFLGIGIGYGIYLLLGYITKRFSINDKPFYIAGIALVLFLSFPGQRLFHETKPILQKRQANDFAKIKEITGSDAYIWTWWDVGNPIQYYSKRATFMDNTYFNPLKAYIILNSLTTYDEEITYKSIAFLTNHRSSTYEQLSGDLPALNLSISKYSDTPQKPVYVLLYDMVLKKSILKDNNLPKDESLMLERRMPNFVFIYPAKDDKTADCGDMVVDLKDESIKIIDNNVNKAYSKISYYNKQMKTSKEFPLNNKSKQAIYLVLSKEGNLHQIIAHEDFEQTMLYRMLIASEDNFKHFELVYEDFPHMVLYRVK